MSALFSLQGLLTVILLFICTCTYIKMKFPTLFDRGQLPGKHEGLGGLCWKASRIGERKSQYVAGALVVMAVHTLFFSVLRQRKPCQYQYEQVPLRAM